MKKIVLFFLLTGCVTNVFGAINDKAKHLKARPVVFLNTVMLIWEDHSISCLACDIAPNGCMPKELEDAYKIFQGQRKLLYEPIRIYQELRADVQKLLHANSISNDQAKVRMAEIDAKICAINEKIAEISADFHKVEKSVAKKIKQAAAIVAKELGACAVIAPSVDALVLGIYIDPDYDITDRVMELLNQEYAESR